MIAMGLILLILFVVLPFFGLQIGISLDQFVKTFFLLAPIAWVVTNILSGWTLKKLGLRRDPAGRLAAVLATGAAILSIILMLRPHAS